MRIMHVMGGGDVGGAKTQIMNTVTGLNRNNDVMLISFRAGPFADEARERGIDVRVIERHNPFRAARTMRDLVDAFKPDIIHCHGGRANLMGAMVRRSRQVPIVTTVHSDYRLDYLGSPLKQYTLGTANAIALRFLDFYQPVADRMARTLIERGFDPERIVKIYNGMDFDRPKGEFDRVAYLRDTYGAEIEDGDVLCGIAARLTAVKDIATTIRGFAAALKSAPQLRLFIAGDGEDEDMLKNAVRPARRARARDILRLGIAGHAVLPRDGYQPAVLGVRNLPVLHSGGRLCRLRDHLLGCRRHARAHRYRRKRLYLPGRGR